MNCDTGSRDLTLEDIHSGEKFILGRNDKMFKCGRKRTNEIVSKSILASREHCLFLRDGSQIYVIDKASGNGTYVNGKIQLANYMALLKINDIIGLGTSCVEVDPSVTNATPPTVYRLKLCEESPAASAERMETDFDLTPPSSKIANNASENKRRLSKESSDSHVPYKLPKTDTEACSTARGKNFDTTNLPSCSIPKKDVKDEMLDIIDITDDNSPNDESTDQIDGEKQNDKRTSSYEEESSETIKKKLFSRTKSKKNRNPAINVGENEQAPGTSQKENSRPNDEVGKSGQTEHSREKIIDVEHVKPISTENKYEGDLDYLIPPLDVKDVNIYEKGRTPLKLKHIKQEITMSYSQIDLVTLSDDEEDDFFPASQLFGDDPEDVKKEVTDYIEENEIYNDDRNDEPDIVLLTDSENEDDSLYNRVLQSSLNESRDFEVKNEPEVIEPDAQMTAPPIQNDMEVEEKNDEKNCNVNELQEIYDLCFKEDSDDSEEPVIETRHQTKKKRSTSTENLEREKNNLLRELKELDEAEERYKDLSRLDRRKLDQLEKSDKLKEFAKLKEVKNHRMSERKSSSEDDNLRKINQGSLSKSSRRYSSEKKTHDDRTHRVMNKQHDKPSSSEESEGFPTSGFRGWDDLQANKKAVSTPEPFSNNVQNANKELSRKSVDTNLLKEDKSTQKRLQTHSIDRCPVVLLTKVDQPRRSLEIVDPPFLAKGERRSVSIKKVDKSMREESTDDNSTIETDDQVALPREENKNSGKKPSVDGDLKLTVKQRKELEMKKKQELFMQMKEQKLRKLKNKWADCLPPRCPIKPSLSRQEKEEIRHDRKEKLKKLADEKKKASEANENSGVKRPVRKPIAKVTEKTRGDMLVNEMSEQGSKNLVDSEPNAFILDDNVNAINENSENIEDISRVNGSKSSKDIKCRTKSLDALADNLTNGKTSKKSCDNKLPKVTKRKDQSSNVGNVNDAISAPNHADSSTDKLTESDKSTTKNQDDSSLKKLSSADALSVGKTFNETGSSNRKRDPRIKIVDPITKLPETNPSGQPTRFVRSVKPIKHVSFNDLLTQIRTFEIEPGNSLKKCPTTDAPLQENKELRKRKLDKAICPKLEQFLIRIFNWNPAWLQEQKRISIPPPIVDEKELVPLLSKYLSYDDYYKITEPLMALEFWYQITRDMEISEKTSESSRNTIMFSLVSNSLCLTTVPLSNIRVTTMMLEVVVSRRDLNMQMCPNYGDLIFFEYATNVKGKKGFCTVFAYVEKVRQAIITPFTHYNRDLLNYVKEPYAVLTYSVVTKPIDCSTIETNRVYRMRKITYLRANMRMIQALQYLPISPLLNQILHPKVQDYELPEMQRDKPYSLITKDNLNNKQLEAVVRVADAVNRKLPKLCLIQGPPGTGKSKVIVNLVTEILYAEGHYNKNKRKRILVCAPSNTAIDEIVLRLLEVRQSIPESTGRFKMVRIGKLETMHPVARNISLKTLAKRDVKTTTENYMSSTFTIDSVEEEKRLLTAKVNSQKLELLSAQSRNAPDVHFLTKTLAETQSRLDLLTNRRPLERIEPKELAKLERGAEAALLMGADVITCTLSSCYTGLMESIFSESGQEISICIVDEATQCAEAETLIPLMLGVRTMVLVGDTNQLPATIISQKAKQLGLDQSLFSRIQKSFEGCGNSPIIQLDTQYRMAWPVAFWPNKFFYGGSLKNAANLRTLPFHFYKVLNLDAIQDNDKFSNMDEATFIANVFFTLLTRSNLNNAVLPVRVGIITPYNNQKNMIKNKIRECISKLPDSTKNKMVYEVNTVDSFQGQERDVIVMSCVRSSGIGFLSDRQRLCVALTRAKHSLILCGNFRTFERDPMWNALLSDAKGRGVYTNIKATASPDDIKSHIVR